MLGKVPGVASVFWGGAYHKRGHVYGDVLRQVSRAKFNSLASLFKDISPLAKISIEEAFAEGYTTAIIDRNDLNGQLLLRSVSRLPADPLNAARQALEEEEAVE